MSEKKDSRLRFAPVIVISLAIILFGIYKTYSPIINVRQRVVSDYYNSRIEPTSVAAAPAAESAGLMPTVADKSKTIEEAVLNTRCQIEIKTEKKIFNVTTEGLMGDCTNEPFGQISNARDMLVFSAIFGSKPNLIKLFLLDYEKTAALSSWKDGEVRDFIFLPDDMLTVLVKQTGKMMVYVYDTRLILAEFPRIFSVKTGYINPGIRQAGVEIGSDMAVSLMFKSGKINILTAEKTVLKSMTAEDIFLNSTIFTISPAIAMEMAENFHADQGGEPGKAEFNRPGSSETAWRVDFKNPAGKIIKQYMVNNKTGEIN